MPIFYLIEFRLAKGKKKGTTGVPSRFWGQKFLKTGKTVGFRNGRKISTKVGIDQNEQSRGTDYSKCLSPRWSRSRRKTDVSGRRTHVWQAKPNGRLLGFVSRTRQNRGRMDSPQHTFVAISRQECDNLKTPGPRSSHYPARRRALGEASARETGKFAKGAPGRHLGN